MCNVTNNILQARKGGYNAFEKDFAIINIFFGDSTAMGILRRGYLQMIYFKYLQSMRGVRG